ncbi:putative phosphotyrosine-binding protein [Trypoxylus dichotomus]
MSQKSKTQLRSVPRMRIEEKCLLQEAAERYADTCWRIHHDWYKKKAVPTGVINTEQNVHKSTNNNIETASNVHVEAIRNGTANIEIVPTTPKQLRKIIEIQTVQTTCEKVPSSAITQTKQHSDNSRNAHSHEEPIRNGSGIIKTLSSSSYSGNYETLTSQPRPTKNCNATGGMDLSYVTERIIALWFPASCSQQSYKQGQQQAAHMLTNKHGDNYMVFNLSDPKRTLRNEHKHVKEVGWSPRLAPPLEKICSVCKEIDSWLSADQHRIAVLHAKGSKDKLGVVVAAYMHYSSICGSAEQALDRFSMKKYLDDNIGPLQMPSNKRYVDYFAGLLSHNIKINTDPLYLTHVTVLGAPKFQAGGCRAFLKLYEGHNPVYTSGVYSVSSGVSQFTVNVAGERRRGLQLRGDILIKCYHRSDSGRETIFACQFHTCAVADYTLSFTRQELDGACNDPRFPVDGAVELHFSSGSEGRSPAPAPTPAVPMILSDDPVTRVDTPILYEESDEDDSDSEDVNHTFGPLDGSLYATITKKPELSPGAVSSPLTVSMDSGISSAGHHQNANTNASTSPPLTAQPSPQTPEDQHRELDELLSDMMLTVQSMPDPKPNSQSISASTALNIDNVRYIDEEEDKNIPYHARQDSRPFTYGVNSTMIEESKKLSSPSLVRKASFNKSTGDTLKKVQTQVMPDFSPKANYTWTTSNYHTKYNTSKYEKKDPIDDIFTTEALNAPDTQSWRYREVKRYDPMKRSFTEDTLRRSPEKSNYKNVASAYSDSESISPPRAFRTKSPEYPEIYNTSSTINTTNAISNNNNLTWLQRQQLKLKERKEMQLREERQHEILLMSELRNVQSRHMRPMASHRLDGYTSDTTAFADDDDEFMIPLHINTKNPTSPESTVSYSTIKSNYSTINRNERPFVAVHKAHKKYEQNPDSTPASILAANPLGHVVRSSSKDVDSVDSGLLSVVDHQQIETHQQHQQQQLQLPHNYKSLQQQHSPRYNSSTNTVGIHHSHHHIDSSQSRNIDHSPSPIRHRDECDNARTDALSDLMANLSNGSDKSNNSPNSASALQYRNEDTYSTWRSQSFNDGESSSPHSLSSRPQTPAFPVARTPYQNSSTPTVQFDLPGERLPPKSPTTQRKDRPTSPSDLSNGSDFYQSTSKITYNEAYQHSPKSPTYNGSASPTVYYGNSRRSSVHSNSEPPQEVSPAHVKFVRDTSKYWYKPTISREEAINMLRNQLPGTFVVRDSNSFPGAFGMALKVASVPPNIQFKSQGNDELVRHFLIEPTSQGVRLKGCANEPVFSSLSALVYQHSITQMALPCRLVLPESDIKLTEHSGNTAQVLITTGAACNVLYLYSLDMESLTGPEAVKRAVEYMFQLRILPQATVVHFKVNGQGITLTDNKRKLFFRKHYPVNTISHCGLDPTDRLWVYSTDESGVPKSQKKIFGFVARKPPGTDNQCHLFAELEPEQPATAIVNFVNKMLNSTGTKPLI